MLCKHDGKYFTKTWCKTNIAKGKKMCEYKSFNEKLECVRREKKISYLQTIIYACVHVLKAHTMWNQVTLIMNL